MPTMSRRFFWTGWGVAAAVAIVALLLWGGLVGGACHLPATQDLSKDLPVRWCWEFWLNRYQTLVTGLIAIIAAAVAWIGVAEQIKVARLPLVTRDIAKVRALGEDADETVNSVDEQLTRLAEELLRRAAAWEDLKHIADVEDEIQKARRALDRRWIDSELTDAAFEALRDYAIGVIDIGGDAGRLAALSDTWCRSPRSADAEVEKEHVQKAVDLIRRHNLLSKQFKDRLLTDLSKTRRQRDELLGLKKPALD